MLKVIASLSVVTMLGGCFGSGFDLGMLKDFGVDPAEAESKIESIEAATLGNAVKPLPYYCKSPPVARLLFREKVNSRPEAGGAQIGIYCPGDPPLTLGAP